MINTYSSPQSPCGFCCKTTNDVPAVKKEDYIQINFDGNDTTLFIRETSVEHLKVVEKDKIESIGESASEVPSSLELFGSLPEEYPQTQVKIVKSLVDVQPDDKAARNKQFDKLYFKKWSGKTYFEEELRKIRIQEYQKDVEESIKKRNLWKAFQKELEKERRRDLIRTSGPEWWQEPSRKQICLVTSLGDVLTADYEEGVTGRTRQWLLDLGVTTRVTPKQVRACMKRSLLDPIDFLLETHCVILKSQLNIKKKRGDLERPFSVNERLLLSAVCVLHLPTLLTMLHYILPPPKPYATEKHIQELLFGDLDDERVRYSTPYMEPIPFRNQSHFLNWAVDKVFRALLPSMIMSESLDEHKEELLSNKIPSMRMSLTSRHRQSVVNKKRATLRISENSNTGDSITWLITQCIAKRQITPSLYPFYEMEDGRPKFYSRQLTKLSVNKQLLLPSFEENDDDTLEKVSETASLHDVTSGQKLSTGTVHKNIAKLSAALSNIETKTQLEREPNNYFGEMPKLGKIDVSESVFLREINNSQDLLSKGSPGRSTFDTPQVSTRSNNKDDVLDKSEGECKSEEAAEDDRTELEKLWEEIAALPKKQQLQHALGVLRGLGDPLARLPKVHTIPTVLRWLELRQGKNRVLSKEARDELMRRSRGMWKLAPIKNDTGVPKVNCSKKVERMLTWDKKKWLGTEVTKAVGRYYTTVKQEKVDNTRTFFPTMLNHYDHGSKLNRDFRDVFFTYLPAREADTFVYKPWQPQDVKS